MRYIRYALLLALAIVLVTVAFANREAVTLRLLPEDLAPYWSGSSAITMPLFLVIFGSIIVGILLGFVWEWFREHRQRAEATVTRREKDRLSREVARLKDNGGGQQDEVLRLLEDTGAKR